MKLRSTAAHRVNFTTQLPIIGEVTFDENREIVVEDETLAAELLEMGLELVDADAPVATDETESTDEEADLSDLTTLPLATLKDIAIKGGIPAGEVNKLTAKAKVIALINAHIK